MDQKLLQLIFLPTNIARVHFDTLAGNNLSEIQDLAHFLRDLKTGKHVHVREIRM
jgi:hypothetical protein